MSLALEDIAQVGTPTFGAALRAHTSTALSDAYDNQCINGNGMSSNVNGLINQLTDPTDPTTVAVFDTFVAAFVDAIDGLWATMLSEVAIVANVDAYKLSAKTFRGDSTGVVAASVLPSVDFLRQTTAGWWCNKRMPATASTIARGIIYRKGRPGIRTACHPTWGTIAIDDICSASASGQRHFSVHVLCGDKVLLVQPDAYDLVEFKVAS